MLEYSLLSRPRGVGGGGGGGGGGGRGRGGASLPEVLTSHTSMVQTAAGA